MKSLLLLTFFAIICTVLSEDDQENCTDFHGFENGCNNCKGCRGEDGVLACSSKTCPPPSSEEDDEGSLPAFKCKPGCNFKKDCNTCICSGDGNDAACTLIACNVKGD